MGLVSGGGGLVCLVHDDAEEVHSLSVASQSKNEVGEPSIHVHVCEQQALETIGFARMEVEGGVADAPTHGPLHYQLVAILLFRHGPPAARRPVQGIEKLLHIQDGDITSLKIECNDVRLSRKFSPDLIHELNHVLLLRAVHESCLKNHGIKRMKLRQRTHHASVDFPVSRGVDGFHLLVVVVPSLVVFVVFELRSLRNANIKSDERKVFQR